MKRDLYEIMQVMAVSIIPYLLILLATYINASHNIAVGEMPSHSHGIKCGYGDIGNPACSDDAFRYQYWGGSNRVWHTWLMAASGGNGKHNTLPSYYTARYYRRTK